METKHTPAPWHWGTDPQKIFSEPYLFGSDNSVICHFGDDDTYYPSNGEPPNKADSLLIAAAPELLAALEYMLEFCPSIDPQGEEAHNRARAAIAKATGQQ